MLARSLKSIEKSEERATRLIDPAVTRMIETKGDVALERTGNLGLFMGRNHNWCRSETHKCKMHKCKI